MPMLNSITKVAAKPLPRMISPKAHAILDYVIAGTFFATAGWFWRHNKRAAIGSLLCGSARLAVSLLTDYPGGVRKVIHFPARREIDLGIAAMVATMPEFLGFKDEPQKKFFITQGVLITAANELTQFPESRRRAKERTRAA
ncbi:MAG TPA: hypothetical protein VKQ11_22420 [Candidatus Sulfotelmatobacter sp.]|nr:hypothetical protein [Candidatus Sulfotelmatobacter sp.]